MKRIFTSCLLTGFVAFGAPASAGPDGAKVVRGDVKIEKVGDTTVIHASDKSIIKFKTFDIAPGETVQFVQPGQKASVLNKINGAKPTKIEGALLANGRVYLVNKAGVYFAPGAEIRVAEIVAAAGHISNRDFLKGVDRFTDVQGAVRNDGSIHAQAAKLIGANVANTGFISAEDAIVMVSGNDVLIGKRGSRLYVKIGTTSPGDASAPGVVQSGALEAEGGQVLLAGGDSLGMAIEHSGITRAREIELAGSDRGIVEVSGTLDASDRAEGGTGGRIEVTGERIALRSAELDASGDLGGGEVLVGGDFQGKGDVRTSDITFADPDTQIRADAVREGDGGKVIRGADYTTGFRGDIAARGGAEGGDGGLVEVSG
ncbi:MAG TPA: filamentous hemagglutinin N-terminal domain-containing protein, partial [Myxococcota bacterium]|nr:filamentous hemagglutinin N-terminal domain-containing protein [Myxococcota bacterium]